MSKKDRVGWPGGAAQSPVPGRIRLYLAERLEARGRLAEELAGQTVHLLAPVKLSEDRLNGLPVRTADGEHALERGESDPVELEAYELGGNNRVVVNEPAEAEAKADLFHRAGHVASAGFDHRFHAHKLCGSWKARELRRIDGRAAPPLMLEKARCRERLVLDALQRDAVVRQVLVEDGQPVVAPGSRQAVTAPLSHNPAIANGPGRHHPGCRERRIVNAPP